MTFYATRKTISDRWTNPSRGDNRMRPHRTAPADKAGEIQSTTNSIRTAVQTAVHGYGFTTAVPLVTC